MNSDRTADVIVVGGGVMGAAAAYHLARIGQRVLLFEQFSSGHTAGSSHGPSRIIRLAYPDADYVQLARASYALWHALAAESGERLIVQTGGLDIGLPDATALGGIRATFEATGVPFELLNAEQIARRYPQFTPPAEVIGLYQQDYSLLDADRCVAALTALAAQHGARLHMGEAVRQLRATGSGVQVRTDQGIYGAQRLILAAGSWMRPLLRQLNLDLPLRVRKEQVVFLGVRDPQQHTPEQMPLVIHRFPGTTSLGSIFPIFGHSGVKVMIDHIGAEVAPDDPDRTIDQPQLEQVRAYAQQWLPGLNGELIEAVSCRYTMTPDEDFILDRHPAYPQVIIASPCSGHGFKFAPVIGQILAELALHGTTDYPIGRFRLDRPSLSDK